ncbi:MAG: transposase [Actinobacteria bacterium]|nr:transposase [Actinomycetota bacterium]
MLLDIDASIVGIHSENKENAAATFKGTYGFHPMMCFADATGETLAAVLRPGNAGANTVTDHLDVLDQAVAQLPAGSRLVTETATTRRGVATGCGACRCCGVHRRVPGGMPGTQHRVLRERPSQHWCSRGDLRRGRC